MNAAVPVAFNLLLNSVTSFALGLGAVLLLTRTLRAGPGRARLLLWLIPFVKVVWDSGRGIPARSFLWAHLLGARHDWGTFRFGIGITRPMTPVFKLLIGVDSGGVQYSESVPDAAYRLLTTRGAAAVPALLVAVLIGVALVRLVDSARSSLRLRRHVRRLMGGAELVTTCRCGLRVARVYVSHDHRGAPFAGGIVRPFVMFPETTFAALDEPARDAALCHELAHVAHGDTLLLSLLALFSDVFWFLPGLRGLLRRVVAELELCADARAVRDGADAQALAQALVSVGEALQATPGPAPALISRPHLLVERVERLVGARLDHARTVYRHRLGRALVFALFVPFVFSSVLFGNWS